MLVLPHADGFGIDLDKFRQRVREAAADGHRAPVGEIEIRELGAGRLRGGIDRSPAFADHDHGDAPAGERPDEGFGFAPGGAVAHGGDFRAVFLGEAEERFPGFGAGLVRSGVRVDGRVFEQFPFTVEADDFAAGAETGVHGEDVLSAEGRGKQKLAQVFGEHADGFGVGALFELVAEFGLQRGCEKPPVAVQRGCAHFAPAGAVVEDEEAGQEVLRLLLIAGAQGEAQEAFLFAPEHGEDAVGRGLARRVRPTRNSRGTWRRREPLPCRKRLCSA